MIHHIIIVFGLMWILDWFLYRHPIVYFVSLFYLYEVHERYNLRLRKKIQYEERKQANQRRPLADSETVRWLNDAVEKVRPIFMEQIASQKILLPLVPWFLDKYKPWTADINALIAVKLRIRLGFGMWTKLHMTGIHVEGKILVGLKFIPQYPYLGCLRLCFAEPPYFQITVKPIFNHGIDVTEFPEIAGWMDKLLGIVFEQTLVETQKKTLSPNWTEEFRIPICTWESPNVLTLEVCDKDHFRDDTLGDCSVNITDYRSMQRHDMWLPLQNIKTGRLHLAVTVLDADRKGGGNLYFMETSNKEASTDSTTIVTGQTLSDPTIFSAKAEKIVDKYELVIIGQQQTGRWLHHPGSDVPQIWEPRKRKNRLADIKIHRVENTSTNNSAETGCNQKSGSNSIESEEMSNSKSLLTVRRGIQNLSLAFQKIRTRKDSRIITPSPSPMPRPNIRAVNERTTKLKVIVDDGMCEDIEGFDTNKPCSSSLEMNTIGSTGKGNMKEVASDVLNSNIVKELKADQDCSSPQRMEIQSPGMQNAKGVPMNVQNHESVKGFKADDEFLSPRKIGRLCGGNLNCTVKDFKAEKGVFKPSEKCDW
ncbi:hypothetical protein MKX01_041280 [Papaver californicum]|nr:hypothetical protein MKX01_041280 [Papaver californicum]